MTKRNTLRTLCVAAVMLVVMRGVAGDGMRFVCRDKARPSAMVAIVSDARRAMIFAKGVIEESRRRAKVCALVVDRAIEVSRMVADAARKMEAYDAMLDMVKYHEGFQAVASVGDDGRLTVGYGFTREDIPDLDHGDVMSKRRASELLEKLLLVKYGRMVDERVKTRLEPCQRAALISFVYNVGPSAFEDSDLRRFLNRGDFKSAAEEMMRWNKMKGRRMKGLSRRRAAEVAIFKGTAWSKS